jgi:hypothetical protein
LIKLIMKIIRKKRKTGCYIHVPLGAVGYVATLELSSRGGEAGATW